MHTLLFIIIMSYCSSVDGPEKHTVMAISGLNLREEANKNSKVLKTLEFGSIIYSGVCHAGPNDMDNWYTKDTIDGVVGYWIDAESKEFELEGYLFSPYVYYGELVDREISENEIRFSHEGINSGEFDYHPNLHWYGVYREENSINIERINIEIQLSKVKFDSSFSDLVSNDYESVIIKTNKSKRADFIIGTNTYHFKEGARPTIYEAKEIGYTASCENGFLYPTMKKHFYFKDRSYIIKGIENVEIDSVSYKIRKRYDIQFEIWGKDKIDYSKSISSDLNFCCNADRHTTYQTPQLYWMGDINNDGILDCIVYQHTMTESCGACSEYSLFLSDIKNDIISLKFMDTATSCY